MSIFQIYITRYYAMYFSHASYDYTKIQSEYTMIFIDKTLSDIKCASYQYRVVDTIFLQIKARSVPVSAIK